MPVGAMAVITASLAVSASFFVSGTWDYLSSISYLPIIYHLSIHPSVASDTLSSDCLFLCLNSGSSTGLHVLDILFNNSVL